MMLEAGDLRGSLTSPNDDPEISWVQLICTRAGDHPRRKIGLISWADDGRGTIIHLQKDRSNLDGATVAAEYRHVLNRKCPKCGWDHQWRMDKLTQMLESVGEPGRVVFVDLSKLH